MTEKKTRSRTMSRRLKRTGLLFAGLCVLAVLVASWAPKATKVDLGRAVRGPLEVTVDEDGRARVKDRYLVSAPLGGTLARIQLRPGDSVKQGQVLTRIVPLASPLLDPRSRNTADARIAVALAGKKQAHAQVERVRTALEFARKEGERQSNLAKDGAIAQSALDRALFEERNLAAEMTSTEFSAKVADYAFEMAEAAKGRLTGNSHGEQLEIPSPIAGRILKVLQTSEGAVQPGTPLLELGDPHALEIAVDVLTSDAVKIHPGTAVRIDRWGGKTLDGVVRLLEPSAFTRISSLGVEEERVNAIIDLRSPTADFAALGDGYRVEAHILVWHEPNVLKVPSSAVFRHGQAWALYAVHSGVAKQLPVEIGERTGLEVQILNGLAYGEAVVLRPNDRVKDGVKVAER
jgi:HlyD family secretion protein